MLVSKLFIVETPETASASAALVQNGVLEETGLSHVLTGI